MEESENIYDPEYVRELFDRCSADYRNWSAISSFGFIWLWRRQCASLLPKSERSDPVCVDLMAGTGEIWPHLENTHPEIKKITAIDISHEMHIHALEQLHFRRSSVINHIEADVLTFDFDPASADMIVSTFGLKTFNKRQQKALADQINKILKKGGTFALIEASDPISWPLRFAYRFYIDRCLPLIERFFLKGAQDFSMIGTYTRNFRNCVFFAECLENLGLEVHYREHFFGCATSVSGKKLSS
ncbi:MAG: class I SAM-dependent methyltransferase [Pseudomonadota bacterium]